MAIKHVGYRIDLIDTADDNQRATILLDGVSAPQRVFEAMAQGLREHGDFKDVTLTRVERFETTIGF